MFFEKISKEEVCAMTRIDGITPNYTYEDYIIERNEETGEITGEFYINLTIHKTADEVYVQWLKDKENPAEPVPDKNVILLEELESYKHDHIQFLQYDGHTQRYLESDRLEMLDAQESLEKGLMPSIEWKYGFDEIVTYVVVTDPLYFVNMRLNGGAAKQKAFAVEKILTEEINALTEEQLQVYDLKARFDEVFKTLV